MPELKEKLTSLAEEVDKLGPVTANVIGALINLHNAVAAAQEEEKEDGEDGGRVQEQSVHGPA